jgi:hypothetical protein
MTEVAIKADLTATEADLKAAIELTTLRLTVKLGGILIAAFVAIGLLLCQ